MRLTRRGERLAAAVQITCQWAAATVLAALIVGVLAVVAPTIECWS